MNKNLNQPIAILSVIIFSFILLGYGNEHPTSGTGGNTGAPGDGSCLNCHTFSGGTTTEGTIVITGIPAAVIMGETYNVSITSTFTIGSPSFAGFQVVALLDSDDSNAGSWSNNSSSTFIKPGGSKSYLGHKPKTAFPGGGNSITWTADWTAPTVAVDDNITFYGVTNLANGSGTSGDKIKFTTVNASISSTLPVELTSFSLSQEKKGISLLWTSQSEINFNNYEIQSSVNSKNWKKIGEVNGNNTLSTNSYSFFDLNHSSRIHYYRLKMIDNDGSFKYSKVINSFISKENNFEIYPTIATSILNIKSNIQNEKINISIYNNEYKIVNKHSVTSQNYLTSIDINNLNLGNYYILIETEGIQKTFKFIKV